MTIATVPARLMSSITCCAVKVTSNANSGGTEQLVFVDQARGLESSQSRVKLLSNYFEFVAVEVSDIGCVLARAEVRGYRWLALARSACLNRCSERGADLVLIVTNKAHTQSGFTGLTLAWRTQRRHWSVGSMLERSTVQIRLTPRADTVPRHVVTASKRDRRRPRSVREALCKHGQDGKSVSRIRGSSCDDGSTGRSRQSVDLASQRRSRRFESDHLRPQNPWSEALMIRH